MFSFFFFHPAAVATATPIPNGSLNQHSETRPVYPTPVRPGCGYPTTSVSALGGGRAHVTVDVSTPPSDTAYSSQSSYDSRASLVHPPPASLLMHAGSVSSGQPSPLSVASGSGNNGSSVGAPDGAKRHTQLGHPLKSFTVPAPPPPSAPPAVKIVSPNSNNRQAPSSVITHNQPPTSPYKKAITAAAAAAVSSPPPLHKGNGININSRVSAMPGGGELKAAERIHGGNSYSTEELNQEMANLEGLMKDLNAITANEFGC